MTALARVMPESTPSIRLFISTPAVQRIPGVLTRLSRRGMRLQSSFPMALPPVAELLLELVPQTLCNARIAVKRDGAVGWWLRFSTIDSALDEFLSDFERLRPTLQIGFLRRVMSPELRINATGPR